MNGSADKILTSLGCSVAEPGFGCDRNVTRHSCTVTFVAGSLKVAPESGDDMRIIPGNSRLYRLRVAARCSREVVLRSRRTGDLCEDGVELSDSTGHHVEVDIPRCFRPPVIIDVHVYAA